MFVEAIAQYDETQGVPGELRGIALRKWVDSEAESPSKEEIDWTQWL